MSIQKALPWLRGGLLRSSLPILALFAQPLAEHPLAAQTRRPAASSTVPAPIIFVHGNGDHAGLWDQTIERFASNGYPENRLFAIDLPNPLASSTIRASEANRSTPEDQTAALSAFVTRVLLRTGAGKVALVGSSRGGMTIMNYVKFGGGAAHVSHVITCGAPHHGVFAIASMQPGDREQPVTRCSRRVATPTKSPHRAVATSCERLQVVGPSPRFKRVHRRAAEHAEVVTHKPRFHPR